MAEETPLHCYVHPNRETQLRCNRCERPICFECAVQTPTGYRCKECIRSQQKVFETALPQDYLLSPVVAAIISLLGSYFIGWIGFFAIFAAPIVGIGIAESSRWIIKRRRSPRLVLIISAAALVGSLPILLIDVLRIFSAFQYGVNFSLGWILPLVWQGVYTILVTSSVYYRLAGIRIG